MAKGVYELPNQLVDEDKWFKIFTKKQLAFVGVGGGLCFVVMRVAMDLGMFKEGLTISIVIAIVSLFLALYKIPDSYYLYGSGKNVYSIIAALIIRKSPKNRVIYCKNYDINCEPDDEDVHTILEED